MGVNLLINKLNFFTPKGEIIANKYSEKVSKVLREKKLPLLSLLSIFSPASSSIE
jgi:hypothetical protein